MQKNGIKRQSVSFFVKFYKKSATPVSSGLNLVCISLKNLETLDICFSML